MQELITSTTFLDEKNIIFIGLPGSGSAITLIKLAVWMFKKTHKDINIINTDKYHVGKKTQLEELSGYSRFNFLTIDENHCSTALNDNINLIYLTAPATPEKLSDHLITLSNKIYSVYLIIDCSRSIELNKLLLEYANNKFDFKIILTKYDLLINKSIFLNLLNKTGAVISAITNGERIPDDILFNFPD